MVKKGIWSKILNLFMCVKLKYLVMFVYVPTFLFSLNVVEKELIQFDKVRQMK